MKYNIYSENEIKENTGLSKVYLEFYPAKENAPFALICPGGAYEIVSDFNEGKPFAQEFNKRGYNAFVLFYRVGAENADDLKPVYDLKRAVEFIKSKAGEFRINPNRFCLVGSSAGGHLCSYFTARYNAFESDISLKPDCLVLAYPVITMFKKTHELSRRNFLGSFSDNKYKQADASVENLVNADFPPTFFWHNKDDGSVDCINSLLLKEALEKYGVPNECLLFEKGGHGIGLAEGYEAEGWMTKAIDFADKYL